MKDINIKQIAQSIQNGDEQVFKEFYEAYFPRIFRFIAAILKNPDDAEDVTSLAFIYVWDNSKKLQKGELLASWLYQIAKHRALDFLRKKASRPTTSLEGFEDSFESGEHADRSAQNYFQARQVEILLSDLSGEERALIYLRFVEDLSFEDIAERTGSRSVTIRVRYHRAIKKLQKNVKNKEDDSLTESLAKFL